MVVEEQAEESGWTSYLDCPSLSLLSDSSFSPLPHISTATLFTLDNFQAVPNTPLNSHLHVAAKNEDLHHHHHHDAHAADDRRRAPSMDSPDEESCGSSTLSDANSSLGSDHSHRNHSCSSRNPQSLKRKQKRQLDRKLTATPTLPTELFEDTATSSPSSDQASKCSRLDISACNGEGDVSKRFKALQALIPCLKEMVGKEKEEEMLNAIINHVRALERKVQLLSDVWRLSQVNHG